METSTKIKQKGFKVQTTKILPGKAKKTTNNHLPSLPSSSVSRPPRWAKSQARFVAVFALCVEGGKLEAALSLGFQFGAFPKTNCLETCEELIRLHLTHPIPAISVSKGPKKRSIEVRPNLSKVDVVI